MKVALQFTEDGWNKLDNQLKLLEFFYKFQYDFDAENRTVTLVSSGDNASQLYFGVFQGLLGNVDQIYQPHILQSDLERLVVDFDKRPLSPRERFVSRFEHARMDDTTFTEMMRCALDELGVDAETIAKEFPNKSWGLTPQLISDWADGNNLPHEQDYVLRQIVKRHLLYQVCHMATGPDC